jgi:hypothetical protein
MVAVSGAQVSGTSSSSSDTQTGTAATSNSPANAPSDFGASDSADRGVNGEATAGPDMGGSGVALSAAQILTILQERPEVVVELKSYLADMLQQQGTSIQADSITDEVLYNQISTSPQVRAGITVFLRSRGFVSDEDLQVAGMTSAQNPLQSGSNATQAPLMTGSPF